MADGKMKFSIRGLLVSIEEGHIMIVSAATVDVFIFVIKLKIVLGGMFLDRLQNMSHAIRKLSIKQVWPAKAYMVSAYAQTFAIRAFAVRLMFSWIRRLTHEPNIEDPPYQIVQKQMLIYVHLLENSEIHVFSSSAHLRIKHTDECWRSLLHLHYMHPKYQSYGFFTVWCPVISYPFQQIPEVDVVKTSNSSKIKSRGSIDPWSGISHYNTLVLTSSAYWQGH